MELFNNLPLFYADVDENVEGIYLVSIVDKPAVQRGFLKLSEEERITLSLDEDRHIMTGLALQPEQKIYRKTEDGREYYITFTKECIQRLVEKFFKDYNATNVNLEHDTMVDSCVIFESYLIDKKRGICPTEFSDLPDGSWMISMKCYDDNLWKEIKEGKYNGFSIEAFLTMEENRPKEKIEELQTIEDLFNWLETLE